MSKNKNHRNNSNKEQPSELGQFVERNLPSDGQVNRFDKYLKGGMDKNSVNESLSEIYQDESGQRVNVKEVDIKPKRSLWMRIGLWALSILLIVAVVEGAYYWIVNRGSDSTAVELGITAPPQLVANEEFEYTIDYRNQENTTLSNLQLSLSYPEAFIFESAFPSPSEGNNKWQLSDLSQFSSGQIKVRGRLIAPVGAANLIFADLHYQPEGITSEFKKSSSLETTLLSSGLETNLAAPTSALVGQDAELILRYKPEEKSFINSFKVRFAQLDVIEFPNADYGENVSMTEPGVFTVSKIEAGEKELRLKFKFKDKLNDSENIQVFLEHQPAGNERSYVFEEETFSIEVVKNSLNLTISANGQPSDQGANFGQTINYSISYVNKGEQTMNEVIVMAVLEGEALDWRKLVDANNGTVSGRTIVWSSQEIPELKALSKNQEGTINFSIPVRPINEAKLISGFDIKSYAQFAISGKSEDLSADNDSNRSNQLTVKVNSDVALDESVRYFDEDNIAVGTGPLPPRSGETTTLKVYWNVTNSLHELAALSVKTKLPDYVQWDGKEQADAGTLTYNPATNEVSWAIGRLPISVAGVEAEFSIALKPRVTDRNKLMILVSGTTLSATDNQTSFAISEILKAQTTRLEKDDIADTDGIVQ